MTADLLGNGALDAELGPVPHDLHRGPVDGGDAGEHLLEFTVVRRVWRSCYLLRGATTVGRRGLLSLGALPAPANRAVVLYSTVWRHIGPSDAA